MNTTTNSQEDIISQNILKKVELAKITRQLKTRLSKTTITSKQISPVKPQLKNSSSFNANINKLLAKKKSKDSLTSPFKTTEINSILLNNSQGAKITITRSGTPPQRLSASTTPVKHNITSSTTKSLRNQEEEEDDEDNSPIKQKRQIHQFPPSSPMYNSNDTFIAPKTPPQQKINISNDIYSTISTNKTQVNPSSSSPYHPSSSATNGQNLHPTTTVNSNTTLQNRQNLLSTPKRLESQDEGADLLMFLATSPSPMQFSKTPSTPSRFKSNSNSTLNVNSSNQVKNSLTGGPATPMRSLKMTPGFNMNDYVNLFTPSPGTHMQQLHQQSLTSTNGGQGKGALDVNAKRIRF